MLIFLEISKIAWIPACAGMTDVDISGNFYVNLLTREIPVAVAVAGERGKPDLQLGGLEPPVSFGIWGQIGM